MYINEVNKFKAISMTIRIVNQTIPKKKKNLVQYVDLHQFKKFNIFFFLCIVGALLSKRGINRANMFVLFKDSIV